VAMLECVFCRDDLTFTVRGYDTVMGWLEKMVGIVINGECKHNGSMMAIFRVAIPIYLVHH
jgi:hypothetical protein